MRNRSSYKYLTPSDKENVRLRIVQEIEGGKAVSDVASSYDISRTAVHRWVNSHNRFGISGIEAKQRGRPKGSNLTNGKSGQIFQSIVEKDPKQLDIQSLLWTRRSVAKFLELATGSVVSRWTINRYLTSWNLRPTTPIPKKLDEDLKWTLRHYQFEGQKGRDPGNIKPSIFWITVRSIMANCGQQRWQCYAEKERGDWAFLVSEKLDSGMLVDFFYRLTQLEKKPTICVASNTRIFNDCKINKWLRNNTEDFYLHMLPD